MESNPERIMNNLCVIASVTPSDKLTTNDDRFDIHPQTTLREVYRAWYGEKRGNNIFRVRQTIHSAVTAAQKSLGECVRLSDLPSGHDLASVQLHQAAVQHVRLCHGLSDACIGLFNLQQTYRNDKPTSSQIDNVIHEIRDFLTIIHPQTEKMRRVVSPDHFETNRDARRGRTNKAPAANGPHNVDTSLFTGNAGGASDDARGSVSQVEEV